MSGSAKPLHFFLNVTINNLYLVSLGVGQARESRNRIIVLNQDSSPVHGVESHLRRVDVLRVSTNCGPWKKAGLTTIKASSLPGKHRQVVFVVE